MRRIVVAISTLALAGCQGAGPGDGTPTVAPPTVVAQVNQDKPSSPALRGTIVVGTTRPSLAVGGDTDTFRFLHLRDMWVRVTVPTMNSTGVLEITLINPKGDVTYEKSSVFSLDPNTKFMPWPNLNHPVDVVTATKVPGGIALDQAVAVAGTVMTRMAMINTGTWTVKAKLDGGPEFVSTFEVDMSL